MKVKKEMQFEGDMIQVSILVHLAKEHVQDAYHYIVNEEGDGETASLRAEAVLRALETLVEEMYEGGKWRNG